MTAADAIYWSIAAVIGSCAFFWFALTVCMLLVFRALAAEERNKR